MVFLNGGVWSDLTSLMALNSKSHTAVTRCIYACIVCPCVWDNNQASLRSSIRWRWHFDAFAGFGEMVCKQAFKCWPKSTSGVSLYENRFEKVKMAVKSGRKVQVASFVGGLGTLSTTGWPYYGAEGAAGPVVEELKTATNRSTKSLQKSVIHNFLDTYPLKIRKNCSYFLNI